MSASRVRLLKKIQITRIIFVSAFILSKLLRFIVSNEIVLNFALINRYMIFSPSHSFIVLFAEN